MAYDITDFSRTEIYITDGWREWYVPKFRIFMILDGDFCYLYWTDTEKGSSGLTRMLALDYNDVTFGYLTPSSASEVELVIEQYIDSAWTTGGGGVQSVTGLDTDNTDPLNPVIEIAVDGITITGDGTPGNPLEAVIPAPVTPDLDAVLTAGNDGGAIEIVNIADGTATDSAATVGQVLFALHGLHFQFNYNDGATYYFSCLPYTPDTVNAARWAQKIPYDCTIQAAAFLIQTLGTIGTAEDISLYIRVNNTTDYLIATVALAARERHFDNSALNGGSGITITAGDYIHYKIVCPTWVTNPTVNIMGGNIYCTRR